MRFGFRVKVEHMARTSTHTVQYAESSGDDFARVLTKSTHMQLQGKHGLQRPARGDH